MRPLQRQHAVDDGLELAFADEVQQGDLVLRLPGIGAGDRRLERPDVADVLRGGVTRRRSAGQQAAEALQHAQAVGPGLATEVVADYRSEERGVGKKRSR